MSPRTRRDVLKQGLAAGLGVGLAGIPAWALPPLAQGETLVPFTDLPATLNFTPAADRRLLDIRTIDGPLTPADRFFTIQHYGHPAVDAAAYRLRITGLVDRPAAWTIDELKQMPRVELVAGFECSGNRRPLQGLVSNGRWTGVPLRAVLSRAGLAANAREVVFYGADRGPEEVDFRTQKFTVDQHYGRSLARDQALADEPLLAYALNGEPLSAHQGAPLRLLVPGWYGAPNVKWLSHIHVQQDQFLGKYQARWYRTLRGETIDGTTVWTETAITRMRLKSFIARVTVSGGVHTVSGVVLNDGTPIRSVEVRVDDGPWQPASLDPATADRFSWKRFTYRWAGATPGGHTLVSRVTDANGLVQPTASELETKRTFLEDNSQHPRTIVIG